jgi:hypothetical protein
MPMPDELTAPFWKAAHEHRLTLQRCDRCRRWNHGPALLCPSCGSTELTFEQVSGRATLYSWTLIHDPPAPGFAKLLPLVVGLVELEEQAGLLMIANIVETTGEALRVGLPLTVEFEDVSDEISLPQFRPAKR